MNKNQVIDVNLQYTTVVTYIYHGRVIKFIPRHAQYTVAFRTNLRIRSLLMKSKHLR